MTEIEKDILNWHKMRFPNVTRDEIVKKCDEEVKELSEEMIAMAPWQDSHKSEIADVIITHIAIYGRIYGESLEDIVAWKFEKVKKKYKEAK